MASHTAFGGGASVIVTRPDFSDFPEVDDSDVTGLNCCQLDLTDRDAAARLAAAFGPLTLRHQTARPSNVRGGGTTPGATAPKFSALYFFAADVDCR